MKEEEKYWRSVGAGALEVRPPISAGSEERWRQGGSRKYIPSNSPSLLKSCHDIEQSRGWRNQGRKNGNREKSVHWTFYLILR